jgi:hypothetical protein
MSVDDVQEESTSTSLAQSSASVEPSTRPTSRKLPKFPIDLNMPMMVYWPHDDNKLIRSLREWENGGPLSEQTTISSESGAKTSDSASNDSKKQIHIPGVSVLPEYEQTTASDFTLPSDSYLQYSTPSWLSSDIHFDRQRVEYGIDDADLSWLAEQNLPTTELDEEAMELLIDILEKESFRQLEFRQINVEVAQVDPEEEADADDQPCAACGVRDCDDENPILFCDGCDLPVHQGCQDLQHVPDGDWFCDTCVYRMVPTTNAGAKSKNSQNTAGSKSKSFTINMQIPVPCILCGMVDGGIFKKTHIPGRFVHLVCALMTPEVWFEHDYANVSRALQVRKSTECAVCGFTGGVVKCHHRTCFTHYHVTCARENGQRLYFHLPDPENDEEALSNLQTDSHPNNRSVLAGLASKIGTISVQDASVASESTHSRSKMDESISEDVEIMGDDPFPLAEMNGIGTGKSKPSKELSEKTKKRKKRKAPVKKKTPHQPFQSLCALHSGLLRVEKIEEARSASLALPVEVGRFLREEEFEPTLDDDMAVSDTTTFTKAVSILRKQHSLRLELHRTVFDRVVAYWIQKRAKSRLGHMPFIFQLHVLVTHFKENFDAGRKLESRPRQVELTLAQYSNEKKFEILKQLRDGVEALRTLADLVKKREVKKRQAISQRLALFDAAMQQEDRVTALRRIFAPSASDPHPHPFTFGTPPLTIRIPVAQLRRSYATSTMPIAAPPQKKKILPLVPPKASSNQIHTLSPSISSSDANLASQQPVSSSSTSPPSTSHSPVKPFSTPSLVSTSANEGTEIPILERSSVQMDVDAPECPSDPMASVSSTETTCTVNSNVPSEVNASTEDLEVVMVKPSARTPIASPTKSHPASSMPKRSNSLSPNKKSITDYFRPIPPKPPMPIIPIARSTALTGEILD